MKIFDIMWRSEILSFIFYQEVLSVKAMKVAYRFNFVQTEVQSKSNKKESEFLKECEKFSMLD